MLIKPKIACYVSSKCVLKKLFDSFCSNFMNLWNCILLSIAEVQWYLLALRACTVRACVHLNRAEHKLRVSAVRSLRRPPSFGRVETNSFGTFQPPKSEHQLCRPTVLASFRHFDTRLKSFSFTSFSDHLFYLELKFLIPDGNHCKVAHTVKETAL